MKKLSTLLLLSVALFAFAPSDAQADCCYDSCDCMDFDVSVDFLYWKPCMGDLSYAAKRDNDKYNIESICPEWEPGVRVSAASKNFLFGWELGASYTHLNTNSSSSASKDGNILSVNSHPGFSDNVYDIAKGTWRSNYQEWDVVFSFNNSCNECHELIHSFGVAGVVLDQKLVEFLEVIDGINQRTKWTSNFWGVGFRLGSDYTRKLTDCISFYANGHGSILVGNADSTVRFSDNSGDDLVQGSFSEDTHCQLVPGYHLGAGFTYLTCVCNYDLSLRLGYEFLAWHNLPSIRTFVKDGTVDDSEVAISTSSNARVYGFHGLRAGFQLSF